MLGAAGVLLGASLRRRAAGWAPLVSALAASVSVSVTLLGLAWELGPRLDREAGAAGPNLAVRGRRGLETAHARAAAAAGGLAAAVPLLYRPGTVGGARAVLVGAPLRDLLALTPAWRTEPRAPRLAADACLPGRDLAARIGLKPGDETAVSAGGRRTLCRVAAVLSTGEEEDDRLLMPLESLQALRGEPGAVSVILARVDGGLARATEASGRIEAALPELEAQPLRRSAVAETRAASRLSRLAAASALALLFLAGLSAATTAAAILVERRAELALLRAVGKPDAWILGVQAAEACALGALGGAAGWGIALGLSRALPEAVLAAPATRAGWSLPAALGLGILTAAAGFIPPCLRALAEEPARSLQDP